MVPPVFKHAIDLTGQNPDNFVAGEEHTLNNRPMRAVVPNYGTYYAESLVITDVTTGLPLIPGAQFYPAEPNIPACKLSGLNAHWIFIITDPAVGPDITIDYQAVGGEYSSATDALLAQIERLDLDERPVAWGDIIGKPDGYPPLPHLHDIGDTYGWEYSTEALYRIADALLIGDRASHDAIYRYIDELINNMGTNLAAHLSDHNNPHQVTAEQISVYTKAQIDAFNTQLINAINDHRNNYDNPHQTTAAQVGAYTKAQVDGLLQTEQEKLDKKVVIQKPTISPTNWNLLLVPGMYSIETGVGVTGFPGGANGAGILSVFGTPDSGGTNNQVGQLYFSRAGRLYIRVGFGGVNWTAWQEILFLSDFAFAY